MPSEVMVETSQFVSSFRSSPFWQSPPQFCFCNQGPALGGLDLVWYFRQHREELGSELSIDACVAHYCRHAGSKLLSPNLAFDEFWYRARYPDADLAVKQETYASGWAHYVDLGARSGYNPGSWFDERWYQRQEPEAVLAIRDGQALCGFQYFLNKGILTETAPSLYFNPAWYAAQHTVDNGRIPLVDYLSKGANQRPCPVPFFDEGWYVKQYLSGADSPKNVSAYEHYLSIGLRRAYSPSAAFNEFAYRVRYPEVARAISDGKYMSALEHFATEGVANGYVATTHLGSGGLDPRGPLVNAIFQKALESNLSHVANLNHLLSHK